MKNLNKEVQSSSTAMKVQKAFINKRIKPTIGTPDFMSIVSLITTAPTYNEQYYGDALMKIHKKYKFNSWLPFVLFKIGYIQALVDKGQSIKFDLNYSDKATVDKAIRIFNGDICSGNSEKESVGMSKKGEQICL